MKFPLRLMLFILFPVNLIFSQKEESGDSGNYFIFGFSYKPNPDVSITPNLLVETYERSIYGQYYEPSVTARITFFYSYHK